MTKSWELEALAMKNEHQQHSIVTIRIEENKDPDARFKDISGNNYVNVYGKMTEKQRSDFMMHIERYVKLLFQEAEEKVNFRKEWDSME